MMSKNNPILGLLFLVFAFTPALAQQSDVKILVMDLVGEITYNGPGVKSGAPETAKLLSSEGSLKLEEGARITLLANGMPYELNTKGKFKLSEVVDMNLKTPGGFSFDGVFFRRALSAFGIEENEDLAATAGTRGTAFSPPVGSRVASSLIDFSWQSTEANTTFDFFLFDQSTDSLIYETPVSATVLTLDFVERGLEEDKGYCYTVVPSGEGADTAEKVCFTYAGDNGVNGLIRLLERSSKAYPASGEFLQTLMRAVAFERGGFYYDAGKLYAGLLETHPDNRAVQLLQASAMAK